MNQDVEEKTYEFGMLRALGFNRKNIMSTIFTQALTFATPGILSGLLIAAILNSVMRKVLYTLVNNESSYLLSSMSVLIGASLGLFIPIISNIIPIQRALGKNLRISLDLYHRQSSELTIRIKKLQEMGLSVT
jgi:ABC-type antimicrobial peptide transport system permease subunit